MNWFFLKLQLLIFLALGCLAASAQDHTLKGTWLPSSDNYPHLNIVHSKQGIQVIASGGFLETDIEAVRFQQVATSSDKKVQVIFPSEKANIVLNLQFVGESLRASWSRPDMSQKLFRTLYHKKTKTRSLSPQSTGSIKGQPVGKAKSTASIFHVSLYGPDSDRYFISTQSLGKNGGFNFEGLRDGEYYLYIEPRGHTIIEAYPAMKKVIIVDGEASEVNIELK